MNKGEFVDNLAADDRIGGRRQAVAALDAVTDLIGDVLSGGGSVTLTGFGKFYVAERASRQGVNPRTGERIEVPGGRVPRFSAGSGLKSKTRE